MKKFLIGTLLLAASTTAGAAAGTFFTGNELLELLETDKRGSVLYVLAISDSLAIDPAHRDTYCLPETATGGQLSDVVRQYLKGRPEQRHASGAALTRIALLLAFACRK